MRSFFCFILLCLTITSTTFAASFDPQLTWKTLKSEHFNIHFHDGEETLARRTLVIAEQVHAELSPVFDWTPKEPTEIVLSDNADTANGFASPVPYNRINLYVTSPQRITDHGHWLHDLITHEYVHVLHLDKVAAAPSQLRGIFGRHLFLFPNLMQPSWGIEGIATYFETSVSGGYGRGQSSEYDMLMRMEVEGGLKPLKQINQSISSWPAGVMPYLYGVEFYKYIAQTYGEEAMLRWVREYSDNLVPFRLNSSFELVFGKNLEAIYLDFEQYLEEKHGHHLDIIRQQGVVAGVAITRLGYASNSPRVNGAGDLFYVESNGQQRSRLMRLGHDEEVAHELIKTHGVSGIDVHDRAGIVLSQLELCRNVNHFYDLYLVHPETGENRRLTECGRYRSPAWSPDGGRIATVKNQLGNTSLVLLNANGQELETLWQGRSGEIVLDLDWSPDGDHLLASVWREEGGWNLEEFDLEQRHWQLLTAETSLELGPQYSAGGESVIYSADYDGIYNLHRLDLNNGETTKLTNVIGGAFSPAVTEDGPIYYVGYSAKGRDIYRLDQTLDLKVDPVLGSSIILEHPPELAEESTALAYEPWNGLKPRWWFPYLYVENSDHFELGGMTSAWDVLLRHNYSLIAAYDVEHSLAVGSLDYVYNRWNPVFRANLSRWHNYYYEGDLTRIRRSETLYTSVSYPWLNIDRRLVAHAGFIQEDEKDIWRAPAEPTVESMVDRVFGMALNYDSSHRPALGISRQGRNVMLMAEYSGALGGDYKGNAYTLDWREFITLPGDKSHALGLRFVAARGDSEVSDFTLGGSDSASITSVAPNVGVVSFMAAPFKQRRYALRGYPLGRVDLRGDRMALVSMEWRFPLRLIERGLMAPPAGLRQLSAAVFIDSGDAWYGNGSASDWRTGAGVELIAESNIFYLLHFSFRLGYAHGFDDGGEDQLYLRVGSSF